MNTTKRNLFIVLGTLLALALIATIAMFTGHDGVNVMVDGEQVTGIAGAGYAFGGTLIGIIAVILALVLVSLILTGVSIFVMVVLALVFVGVLVLLSPLMFPLLFVGGLVWIFARKKAAVAT